MAIENVFVFFTYMSNGTLRTFFLSWVLNVSLRVYIRCRANGRKKDSWSFSFLKIRSLFFFHSWTLPRLLKKWKWNRGRLRGCLAVWTTDRTMAVAARLSIWKKSAVHSEYKGCLSYWKCCMTLSNCSTVCCKRLWQMGKEKKNKQVEDNERARQCTVTEVERV